MAEKSWSLGRALRGMFVKPTIDETTWDDLELVRHWRSFLGDPDRYLRHLLD